MTKHEHSALIHAWADGAEIEMRQASEKWLHVYNPAWYPCLEYRIKHVPKPDIVHETSISLSPFAGPLLYAASPLDANCVLVFDAETGKLKECSFKHPPEAL